MRRVAAAAAEQQKRKQVAAAAVDGTVPRPRPAAAGTRGRSLRRQDQVVEHTAAAVRETAAVRWWAGRPPAMVLVLLVRAMIVVEGRGKSKLEG